MDIMVAPAQQSKFRSVMSTMNIRPKTLLKDVQRVLDQHKTAFRSRGVPGELSFDRYSSFDEDQLWRKSRSKQANNCIGVDMNRNFDIHWSEVGTNSDPCSTIYPGTHPFSEAETRALWQYVERLKGLAKLYLSFHSYGNMILLPWSYTKSPPYDIHKLKMVAQKAGDSMPEKQYRIGSPVDVLYAVGGSSTDFVKHYAGVGLTFPVEITKTKWGFFLPPEYIQSEVEALYKAVKAFAKALL